MKFRRRKGDAATDPVDGSVEEAAADEVEAAGPRAAGPWDAEERPVDVDDRTAIDLGGLVVRGREGIDIQVPTDKGSERLTAVLLVGEEAAVELRAFAAPRSPGLWEEIRGEILAEVQRLEGQAEEVEGAHGAELRIQVPARTPDGQAAVQPSRIVGVEGPRWFLRGTFMGRAALEPDDDGVLESAFRDVVVRRGKDAMPPREPLEIVLPESARPVGGSADDGAGTDADAAGSDSATDADDTA